MHNCDDEHDDEDNDNDNSNDDKIMVMINYSFDLLHNAIYPFLLTL